MFQLDLLTPQGSLIKHYQINEIELSCGDDLFFSPCRSPVIKKIFQFFILIFQNI